jgi:hypothetical protein
VYVDKKPEVKAVIGIVNIAAHEYTDRSLATASWWDKYDVPEQTVYLLVKRTTWCSVKPPRSRNHTGKAR